MDNQIAIAGYKLTNIHDGVSFIINLSWDLADSNTISGIGKVIDDKGNTLVNSNIVGDFRPYWIDGPRGFMINLTGYPFVMGIPPVGEYIPPNTKLRVILNDSWNHGKNNAEFSYQLNDNWHYVDAAKVERLYFHVMAYGSKVNFDKREVKFD